MSRLRDDRLRVRRVLPVLSLAAAFALPMGAGRWGLAQEAAPAATSAPAAGTMPSAAGVPGVAEQAVDPALKQSVEDYWHYAKIARYDLAAKQAEAVLQKSDQPVQVLMAFEAVSTDRKDNLDAWLLRWQGVDQLKEPVTKLIDVLNQGRYARRADPTYIQNNVTRLSTNERAFQLGLEQLRASGELAVPTLLDTLRDPNKRQYQDAARRALRGLGRLALNPLVAATEMKDQNTLLQVVSALGDIGYDAAVPYLAKIANDKEATVEVRESARQALGHIGATDAVTANLADLFYELGDKFYYGNSAITVDTRYPLAIVWSWEGDKGLQRKDVPPPIFNDIMAMRSSEYALKLGNGTKDATSLWVAANFKREADLPEGATDATRPENYPNAQYWGETAGVQYLNNALSRALRDRNAAVAVKAVRALQNVAGQSNMFTGEGGGNSPLIDAMAYPDRTVRFESAFAVAGALPQQQFTGQERVVPLLAEAVAQTGQPNVLIVAPTQDQVNSLSEAVKADGYGATGSTDPQAALSGAAALPAVDVILLTDDLPRGAVDQVFAAASASPRLARTPKVMMTKTKASPYVAQTVSDPLLVVTQASDAPGLKGVLEEARKRGGALPMDEKTATSYSLRSAELLGKLAISRGQVLDLSASEATLLAALDDARPEVIKASGNALGVINGKQVQGGLLGKASEEKTADDVKVSLYRSLATNAKFFGNQLDSGQVDALQKVVQEAQNLDVRGAAAEARGALNLPADEAKKLIVDQGKF